MCSTLNGEDIQIYDMREDETNKPIDCDDGCEQTAELWIKIRVESKGIDIDRQMNLDCVKELFE